MAQLDKSRVAEQAARLYVEDPSFWDDVETIADNLRHDIEAEQIEKARVAMINAGIPAAKIDERALAAMIKGLPAGPSVRKSKGDGSRMGRAEMAEAMSKAMALVNSRPSGVSRKDVAEHLGVEPQSASNILKKLVKAGSIRSEGERKNTVYLPAGKAGALAIGQSTSGGRKKIAKKARRTKR